MNTFAVTKTTNFSRERENLSLFSEKKKFKNCCLTILDQLHEQRGTQHNKRIVTTSYIETDLGLMVAAATDNGICLFEFADSKRIELEMRQLEISFHAILVQGVHHHIDILKQQIEQYFKGERKNFDTPLELVGTEFQIEVWLSLLKIPYGCTINYAKQAELVGKPTAVRAVANANGQNKISIILPCHRVIGADGTLTGYGGGIERKKRLLDLEKRNRL